jgi:hypothetical protein
MDRSNDPTSGPCHRWGIEIHANVQRRIDMKKRELLVGVTAPLLALFVLLSLSSSAAAQSGPPWGPETPNFNLEVVLRGEGFGLVKFRQPNDDAFIIYLDVWVRDLAPNTSYLLQRAVDTNVDDNCTSTSWLTLGKGLTPQSITTDATGTGRENLFRNVAAFPTGSEFDIHFRVIEEATSAVVLTSRCYQFTISQ